MSTLTLKQFFFQRRDLPLRLIAHAGALVPLLLLAVDVFSGDLTANPVQYIEQRTGKAALILLVAALACTPLTNLTGWKWTVKVARTLGLWTFFYAAVHFLVFLGLDYGFDLSLLPGAIFEKRFVVVGLAAFVILLALAVTSFRWWQKKLGKNWKRLHRLIYLAGGLVIFHYAWAKKGDIFRLQGDIIQPLIFGAIVAMLLFVRIPRVKRWILDARRGLARRLEKESLAREEL